MKLHIPSILLAICLGEFVVGWVIFLAATVFAEALNLESNFTLLFIGPYYLSFGALGVGMFFGRYFTRKESYGSEFFTR